MRDGDRLQTVATFSDSSSILTVEMRFAIGSPTRLESGTWRWSRNSQLREGTVAGRSVTPVRARGLTPVFSKDHDQLIKRAAAIAVLCIAGLALLIILGVL